MEKAVLEGIHESGVKRSEVTIATTLECRNFSKWQWAVQACEQPTEKALIKSTTSPIKPQ